MKTSAMNLAAEVIDLANTHKHLASMRSSADLCVNEASELFDKGDYDNAAFRALASLKYSVGILSPIYAQARTAIEAVGLV